ncbi:uncharacterized protein Dwil_GK10535 [Drosophila willistoni]|uniref:Survival of motor neuron-related-splicing factor 30 n=1 Tax=Drosophila willistoni TaxID=7260 RepID=B4NM19_DROWI|nr:tudor domain-containing protein 3 [Drosophila willistoni]EDW85387.1 uncharacterized protein Dwil_GK10535 [Drosophila willistoni]
MELSRKLKESGWYLTEDGLKALVAVVGSEDPEKIILEALNRDIRDIGGGALSSQKREDNFLPGRVVLQVQRVRNVAAPKCNEESKAAPRLLQMDLSDGQSLIQAVELESVPSLNLNVAPGTKIYFKAEKLQLLQGFLLLRAPDLQLLGGRVEPLYEKWDVARTMLKYARSGRPISGASAPPPWVAFGKKIDTTNDKNFKSLNPMGDKDKPAKENEEFNAMRSEAIATATKAGGKKVFGGGGQNIVDHNIKKILDKGYTEEEARNALHSTRNNLERALFNLKRRKDAGNSGEIPTKGAVGRLERSGRESKRSNKDEAEAAKPAANATLFDFLTNKLPPSGETPSKIETPTVSICTTRTRNSATVSSLKPQYSTDTKTTTVNLASVNKLPERSRFENNVSSSFAAHQGGGHTTSSRGGRRDRDRERLPRGGEKERASSNSYNNTHSRKSEPLKSSRPEFPSKVEPYAKNDSERRLNNNHRGGLSRQENGNRKRQPNSNNGPSVPRAQNASEDFANKLSKITEETANLKINPTKRENRRKPGGSGGGGNSSNRQHVEPLQLQTSLLKPEKPQSQFTQRQQPNPRQSSSYSQLPNGYTYDPSKIMGFQSKETNEFAMSLLKSQGVSLASSPAPHIPGCNLQQPPLPQNFGMTPGNGWLWKSGDLCMAKYWDDGRYYEAEITAVSEKTCVVFFLGYGNHEEVLKSDILPLTDSQSRPLSNISHSQSRFRGDRQAQQQQVYVPPHKREH